MRGLWIGMLLLSWAAAAAEPQPTMSSDLPYPLTKEERERFDRRNEGFKALDELIRKYQKKDRQKDLDETPPPAATLAQEPLARGPLDLFETSNRDAIASAARDSAPYLPEPTWPKRAEKIFFLVVVLGVPTWLLWQNRARLFDLLISALAFAVLIRRRVAAVFAELRRRVIERAG
jgi:hypothetical protein